MSILGAIFGGMTQAVAGASKGLGQAIAIGDETGGRGLLGVASQAFHGFGEALSNMEVTGGDVAGIGFGGGMDRVKSFFARGTGSEVAEGAGQKVGRSADFHMGRVAELDPYHNEIVVPAAAMAQAIAPLKTEVGRG